MKKQGFEIEIFSTDFNGEEKKVLNVLNSMGIEYKHLENYISYSYDDIPVTISKQENDKTSFQYLLSVIEKNKPDIIYTFFINKLIAELSYRYKNIPSVFFIHSNDFFKPEDLEPYLKAFVIKQKNLFVSSEFVQKNFFKSWGIEPFVFPDFIEKEKYIYETKKAEYITMINHNKRKGIDLFFKIASEFPEKKFLLAGNWTEPENIFLHKLEEHKNIRLISPTADMKSIYASTSILLNPSLCEETFGRVIIEAFLNGIPVLSNNTGALKHTMNGAGFCFDLKKTLESDDFDVSLWIKTIKKLENKDYYNNVSENCKKTAQEFLIKSAKSEKKFSDYLINICKK